MAKEKIDITKKEAIKILYNAFIEKGERLELEEIIKGKIFSNDKLMSIFGSTRIKPIWEEVDKVYGIDSARTEKHKLELIKEMQDMYKVVKPFNNKTVARVFRNKMERFFGSWTEAMIISGLKPNSIIPETISEERKDLILEHLINIVLSNEDKDNKIPSKSAISKFKNMPNGKLYKAIYGIEYQDLVIKLDLDKSRRREFNKLSNAEVFKLLKNEMKNNKTGTLQEYSLNLSNKGYEFIYYIEKMEVSWEWMKILMNNNFENMKENKSCTKNQIINILSFKYLLNGRHLRAIEINNDALIQNIDCLMGEFNKGIYEIWLLAENNSKTYY